MNGVLHIENISDYNRLVDQPTCHPLVSFIDFSTVKSQSGPLASSVSLGFYIVFLKEDKHCGIRYGRKYYDYEAGTLVFIGPGQVFGIEENDADYQPSGYALMFHPDLIKGTLLAQHMRDYTFFDYHVYEALHLSDEEKQIVKDCFHKITYELGHAIDKHTKRLIASNVDLFLSYCVRFYERQFITRDHANSSIFEKFEALLTDYFKSEKPQMTGVPTVAYCASELLLSANYFGDLVKKETGKTALEHIHLKVLNVAKQKIFDPGKSVSKVAYELGFNYPQHFTRFFKQHSGYTPIEYKYKGVNDKI